jgi:hypothetical protein
VPARFWLMTILCLSVAAGVVAARMIAFRPRYAAPLFTILSAIVVLDGWMYVPTAAAPSFGGYPAALRGQVVLELPPGDHARDIAAQFRAVVGGWRTVNGYSGYLPSHYPALDDSVRFGDSAPFSVFRDATDLHVVVPDDSPTLEHLVLTQPGAVRIGRGSGISTYRLPHAPLGPAARVSGRRLPFAAVRSPCSIEPPARITDGDPQSRWRCEPDGDEPHLIVDLGRIAVPAALVYRLGAFNWEYPRHLSIETSEDGVLWTPSWSGSVFEPVLRGALANPRELSFTLPLPPRAARYLRFRHTGGDEQHGWSITELEAWGN